jgi:hypothetical protein
VASVLRPGPGQWEIVKMKVTMPEHGTIGAVNGKVRTANSDE